jgi:hypothetical protein
LPLGLSSADFDDVDLNMPDCYRPGNPEHGLYIVDNFMLVEIVLEKLDLSRKEWIDYAN